MHKNLTITSVLGLLVIIFGAFGAHALKSKFSIDQMSSFETAVRYQMYHVLALLFVNMFSGFSAKQKNLISYFFFIGVFFFSGSIYIIQLTTVTAKSIWFVTPLGGVSFVIGWSIMIKLFLNKWIKKNENDNY